MSTALQQQLAGIAANSTHQLDLKAQKARHSKSLLFEPRDAASQSFETVYQICREGFEELCMIDGRFRPFLKNLFSEQSKVEDRTQMTQLENEELDRILESFLGLVGARLLLKPAMKAVEWLVRRFGIQEYNTECVLLTFLPYHTSYIFPTLLSILPEQLPPNFRFLHPYVASLQSPPRHAILSATVGNPPFFTAFCNYVLKVARQHHQSAPLLGFWASITAQSVNGALDASRSGRDAVRQQREEDLVTRLLPILQAALAIKGVPELFLGSCMIMTILATKASLSDKLLDAMMEAIAGAWTDQTFHDGLACIAVISEEKENFTQPRSLTRALRKMDLIIGTLEVLATSHRVSRLVTATAAGMLEEARESNDPTLLTSIVRLIESAPLLDADLLLLLDLLLTTDSDLALDSAFHHFRIGLNNVLSAAAAKAHHPDLIRQAARNANVDLESSSLASAVIPALDMMDERSDDVPRISMQIEAAVTDDAFESMLRSMPNDLQDKFSFLAIDSDQVSKQYVVAFESCAHSDAKISRFLDLPALKREKHLDSPEFLTFLARTWISSKQSLSRLKALEFAHQELAPTATNTSVDFQPLFPYFALALTDASQKVRRAATEVFRQIEARDSDADGKPTKPWMADLIYGNEASFIMNSADFKRLVEQSIRLEDAILDKDYIQRSLVEVLNGNNTKASIKNSVLHAFGSSLALHARLTAVVSVKIFLLQLLSHVGKVLGDARTKILLPLAEEWCALSMDGCLQACEGDITKVHALDKAIIGCISRRTADEVKFLENLVTGKVQTRPGLLEVVFERVRHLLPQLSGPAKIHMSQILLDIALGSVEPRKSYDRPSQALNVLQRADLSFDILAHMVETLPKAIEVRDQSPSAKRPRLSRGEDQPGHKIDRAKLQEGVRRITVVLELVEISQSQKQPALLRPLFHLLSDVHQYKTLLGSDLVYVQNLLFSCLHSVVDGVKAKLQFDGDASVVRTDLIVDAIRTTSSPQIYNSGLLLISSIASWKPDLVLHSVMPLFTFMSSTLLKQSDDYSAHVADQTIASIVPPLAASLKKNGKNITSGAANLLLSFTTAYEHIPLHRRINLFEKLVSILGPNDTFFAIVATLITKYAEADGEVIGFISNLTARFPAVTVLVAARQNVDLVFDALKPKRDLSNILLGLDENPNDVDDTIETLVDGLASVLHCQALRKRLGRDLAIDGPVADSIRTSYASLLEDTMRLSRVVSDREDLDESGKDLLSAVLGLMPIKDFIESSAQLMQTGSDLTRQQVFDSLGARVVQAKRGDSQSQQVFLEVLPNCCYFIQDEQPIATRHAAISCVDQICVKYGKKDRTAVLEAAKQIARSAALGSDDQSLRVVSILCLASMVEVLGEEIVSILPQILPSALKHLESAKENAEVQNSVFSLLSALVDEVPWILSSSYLDSAVASAASCLHWQSARGESSSVAFGSLSARKVNPAELFASVDRAWSGCDNVDAKEGLLTIVRQVIQHNTKAAISKNAQTLFSVMTKAFELRSSLRDDQSDFVDVFELVDQIALDMTLKLNDATFRPFFIRLVEWATTSTGGVAQPYRLLSLYSFTLKLFEQLRSIVTNYSAFLLESAAKVLQTSQPTSELDNSLLNIVLQTLSASFLHDQDDFWQTPSHYDTIAMPLLDQLRLAKSMKVTEFVLPAITNFASAASSPEHLKAMNTTIMSLMRHADSAVRLAAVQCERSITERLNFDWLALLPEMLPYISELQEDDDEDVERETLQWVQQIENITGESLEGMLA